MASSLDDDNYLPADWVPREASGPITHATYSCDSQSIYISFEDGSVGVLTASTLRLRCRVNPPANLPSNPNMRVYPLVIAVHPSEPYQFALGLTDGGIHVIEPLESEGKWGTSHPIENDCGPSNSGVATFRSSLKGSSVSSHVKVDWCFEGISQVTQKMAAFGFSSLVADEMLYVICRST